MAAIQPGVWGIDLGQCALKAFRLENIDGQVTATAFDYVEHPKILSQPDADPDQLTREALEKFLSRNTLKGDLVVISIPGQSGLARFVKLPPVEEKKITDIVRFEAKQQIPFNLEEVVWDYQKLGSGVVTDGFAMETEIGLFAIKRDTVNRYLQHFKDVNVEVHIVQMAPLALCNYLAYDLLEKAEPTEGEDDNAGKKRCIVALDIGADNSNLVITDGHRIIWQRPIPLGGNHFTRVLTKDMKLTFAKAEHLKRNAMKSADLKQILSSLKPVLNDFVGEVQRSLGYFTNTHRDAHVQYMIGLGNAFRLPGLQKFLGEKLQLDVRKLQKLERLSGEPVTSSPVYTENVLSFAVAYGLALQGLKVSRLHTNLLPQDIQVERLIRAKKPWAVTAAAALLLAGGILATGYQMQHRAVASTPVIQAMKQGKEVKKTYDDWNKKVGDIQNEIAADTEAVKSIVAGQDERLNWLKFFQFLNEAIPKPDGSNVSEDAKKRYWDAKTKQALEKFQKVRTGGSLDGTKGGDDESWRDNLIQINIESVYCVWCPYLQGYHTRLTSREEVQLMTMTEEEKKTPPDNKGWVFELRGYTYYHPDKQFSALEFLNKVVVGNFRRFGQPKTAAAAPGTQPPGSPQPVATAPGAKMPIAPTPAPGKPASPGASPVPAVAATPKPDDPVNISHVVLYTFKTEDKPESTPLNVADKSILDNLIAGIEIPNDPNMPKVPGMSTLGKTTSSNWQPLITPSGSGDMVNPTTPSGSAEGTTGQDPAGAGKPGAKGPPGSGGGGQQGQQMMGGGGLMGGGAGGGGRKGGEVDSSAPQDPSKMAKTGRVRTEFVLLFVWKEPISEASKAKATTAPVKRNLFGGIAK